jgi:hypothetical protein
MSEEITIALSCDTCGRTLNTNGVNYDRHGAAISVEPCAHCFQAKYDEGHADGEQEASENP